MMLFVNIAFGFWIETVAVQFFYLTYPSVITIIVVNMTEKVSTLEVRQRLGHILNRVALRNDQFIIERKGKPLAAVVPVERLEQMRRAARMHLLQVIERQEGKPSEAQAGRIADEAKHRARKSRHR
jgi:prevent-host-death family protein